MSSARSSSPETAGYVEIVSVSRDEEWIEFGRFVRVMVRRKRLS